ncbi:MAG: malto-oligosyltrehalose synthase [Actinomycetota bacterium]|nr:malto-oligosyltrehalose synthase [Actinomycetota bacterium]
MAEGPARPSATYRLQLQPGFGFSQARGLVGYLKALGVSHVYLSPILAARPRSTHGYDVVDPTRLNPELGTPEEFDALSDALREHGMGVVLDIVPNHMAAAEENSWWMDVLRNGPSSRFARVFDIDWAAQDGKVLLPILGRPFGESLERGELRLDVEDGEVVLRYFEHALPLSPESVGGHFGAGPDPDDVYWHNGVPGEPASFDRLQALLDEQHYSLAHWRVAARDISYRRFFDITALISVRVEDPEVFELTHALVLELVRNGRVDGLRVDHVDGLHDPNQYLRRLRSAVGEAAFLVVEKVLGPGEDLVGEWPVQGTTGYEFAEWAGGLFVDPDGVRRFERVAAEGAGWEGPFVEVAAARKTQVMRSLFSGELTALVRELHALARADRYARDLSVGELATALSLVTARLSVYRTYTAGPGVRREDRRRIERAVREARERLPQPAHAALAFLRRVLLLDLAPNAAAEVAEGWLRFVLRWQRLTGPVTAKGVEDTAMYVFPGLLSRSEVGGHPGEPALSVEEFHGRMRGRGREWPRGLSATSTHDTKRSEDVRARISVLSEIPDEFGRRVARWRRWNAGHVRTVGARPVPDPAEEWRLYQTLVGAWPLSAEEQGGFVRRMQDYAVKAAREAKVHTTWLAPDEAHERALRAFVRSVLATSNEPFRGDLEAFLERVALAGAVSSLAQVVLKATVPGVPDLYQGTELWSLALVDPDNRRPVDFTLRTRMLETLEGADPAELLASWPDGRIKLWVTRAALRFRAEHPDLFARGTHVPLEVSGPRRDNVVAFARRRGRDWSVTLAPRLVAGMTAHGRMPLGRSWRDTTIALPERSPDWFRDVLTGQVVDARDGTLRLDTALRTLPVAVLAAPR